MYLDLISTQNSRPSPKITGVKSVVLDTLFCFQPLWPILATLEARAEPETLAIWAAASVRSRHRGRLHGSLRPAAGSSLGSRSV